MEGKSNGGTLFLCHIKSWHTDSSKVRHMSVATHSEWKWLKKISVRYIVLATQTWLNSLYVPM